MDSGELTICFTFTDINTRSSESSVCREIKCAYLYISTYAPCVKCRISKQYLSGSPEKLQFRQARIQCWTIIGAQVKPHLMTVRLKWNLDPLSLHQVKKTLSKFDPL